ncbi:MAG: hypothetical protein K6C94_02190 [Candidatus Gastranaerophilales bacterium]|nr:hypothetical protein [Candidatus Gastranaerophilales bacterium]
MNELKIQQNRVSKPVYELKYNGHNVTHDFSKYLQEINYTDYEKGQSDELTIKLKDNDKLFQNEWYLEKGAKLTCQFGFENGEILNCGTFTLDEATFDFSTDGDTVEIKSLATTINSPLRTKNSRYFEGTLHKIANDFGQIHGFKVVGDDVNFDVGRQHQFDETDLHFLARISNQFGYIFKITDGLLTFTKSDLLISSDSVLTLKQSDIRSLSLTDTQSKIYKACTVQYFNPKTKKLCSYTERRTNGTDTLKLNLKANNKAEAIRMAKAGLNNGSKEVKGNITLKNPTSLFVAGLNFTINGFGRFDGKYHITSASHTFADEGWNVSGAIEKCI